jgi:hypothetical protein
MRYGRDGTLEDLVGPPCSFSELKSMFYEKHVVFFENQPHIKSSVSRKRATNTAALPSLRRLYPVPLGKKSTDLSTLPAIKVHVAHPQTVVMLTLREWELKFSNAEEALLSLQDRQRRTNRMRRDRHSLNDIYVTQSLTVHEDGTIQEHKQRYDQAELENPPTEVRMEEIGLEPKQSPKPKLTKAQKKATRGEAFE